eukprot:CAMPEP_0202443752 /NCGR_PEP_ID=MMETSP1360-20130828/2925_1 /ASSEMBLY_ACC=CAM_ASM_000848 /TAXON_ID=515479 /ORGANISM="Licmophora paradoxa, Strain CCMP2313" /LENGTH=111 /DNA_ID=CAMNT_0049059509 /DNA_START=155 /DNA_END=487 /DNA_ORIENTATION=+
MEIPIESPRVLFQWLYLLRQLFGVGVVPAGVDFQSGFHVAVSQVIPAEHAQDGLAQNLFGLPLEHFDGAALFQAAGVAGMPSVFLILPFVTTKMDLFRIDNNNNITTVLVW